MKINLNRVFVRNKMMYPVRVLVAIDQEGKGVYKRITGKGEIGPLPMTRKVYDRNVISSSNIELFSL